MQKFLGKIRILKTYFVLNNAFISTSNEIPLFGFRIDLIWLTFIKSYTISKEKRTMLKRKMKMSFENVSISDPVLLDLREWLCNWSLQPKGGSFAPRPSCSIPPAPSPFPHLILAPFWRCAPQALPSANVFHCYGRNLWRILIQSGRELTHRWVWGVPETAH